jgi:hypothetical protein
LRSSPTESWPSDFYKQNPKTNEDFKCIVEKMITTEEKTQERFLGRNNRDNSDRQNYNGNG